MDALKQPNGETPRRRCRRLTNPAKLLNARSFYGTVHLAIGDGRSMVPSVTSHCRQKLSLEGGLSV